MAGGRGPLAYPFSTLCACLRLVLLSGLILPSVGSGSRQSWGFPCLRGKGCLTPGGGDWNWELLPMLATNALVIHRETSIPVCGFLIPGHPFCARAGSSCGFWAGCSQHLALPSDVRGMGGSGRSDLGCLSGEGLPLPCPPLCFHKPLQFDSGFLKIKHIHALDHEAN